MSCVACGGGPDRVRHRVGPVTILGCSGCGLQHWEPPEGFDAADLYDATYFEAGGGHHGYDDYGALEASLRRTFARRFESLAPPCDGARLLDVGAAFGYAVDEAQKVGWRAFGIERAGAAAKQAAPEVGPRLVVGDALATPFPAASFEGITLWDVIEHLPDPSTALAECSRLLRPGGRLALTTGDVGSPFARLSGSRWHLYNLPEHLWFFTRESLRRLLARQGFRVAEIRAEAAWFTIDYLLERLRKSLLGRDREVPLHVPGGRACVRVNLFDIVTVHATRT
jgi:SAM-dependent methyltransferase